MGLAVGSDEVGRIATTATFHPGCTLELSDAGRRFAVDRRRWGPEHGTAAVTVAARARNPSADARGRDATECNKRYQRQWQYRERRRRAPKPRESALIESAGGRGDNTTGQLAAHGAAAATATATTTTATATTAAATTATTAATTTHAGYSALFAERRRIASACGYRAATTAATAGADGSTRQ